MPQLQPQSMAAQLIKLCDREPSSVCFYCADQNLHSDRSLGITNYTLGLLVALKKSGAMELRAVSSKSSPALPDGIANTILPFATDNIPGRLLADDFYPLLARRMNANVWHYPKGFLPLRLQVRQPKVGTIADTILQFYADKYPPSAQQDRLSILDWDAQERGP